MGFLWENDGLTIGKGVFDNYILLVIVHKHPAGPITGPQI